MGSGLPFSPLTAISPLDGRYSARTAALPPLASEFALIRYRVRVEVEWFLYLGALDEITELPALDAPRQARLRRIWEGFDVDDAEHVRALEAETNHDVKAVEYFVKNAVVAADEALKPHTEFVHFACTSEDINNLAYALMMRDARESVLLPAMDRMTQSLRDLGRPLADIPMLSRTHGQAASPTTVGKELANVVARLDRQVATLRHVEILGKMNGAVGNYNAHVVAYPQVDWPARSREFVTSLGLAFNEHTTQIEPHDYLAELFHGLIRFNQIVLDFDRDAWGYIALGYFKQRLVAGETGSSTMPHKVNPIDFENSEGNIGLANAILGHLAEKLTVSRWQRDLSDSTALRSVGSAFGHCLVAWDSALRGVGKIAVDHDRIGADIGAAWEVLSEAVQTMLRAAGGSEPYEQLKRLTRGQQLDETSYRALLDELELSPEARERLLRLTPDEYTGLAAKLARSVLGEDV
ncbi:MAG: adenylosuccinate lyase [Gammaproteobacteria bacterium]|nr:adenylosuccinate lyase [Gammaproteobacteria bacterium]